MTMEKIASEKVIRAAFSLHLRFKTAPSKPPTTAQGITAKSIFKS